ncbi:MAG: hypothetical protein JWN75_1048 [Candidatus Saccharibacteria bacterium]|nr:hypothetical protein [Candidatus Saccharibacteria bacterium]
MTSNAQQPPESSSSVSALPELTYETFAHVMEMFPDAMNIVVTTDAGEFDVLLGEESTPYSYGDVHYRVRRVGLWRPTGQTKTSAQFMDFVGVSATSDEFLFLEDDRSRIRRSLKFTAVKWLDDFEIDIPDDLLRG